MTKVTTVIPAFNQDGYIDASVLSALRQIGSFDHEILVSSDGSTDGTWPRIRDWVRRHPALISDISEDRNVGISENFRRLFSAADGDYIAILEGDDLWSSSTKLARQLDFMAKNPECSMVFSKILVRKLPSGDETLLPRQENIKTNKLRGEDFLNDPAMNLIANFSCCLLKADLIHKLPDRLFQDRFNEIGMVFFLEQYGPIGFLDEVLSVYHQHPNGVWSGSSRRERLESGLKARKAVLEIADARHANAIQKVIDRDFLAPLAALQQ